MGTEGCGWMQLRLGEEAKIEGLRKLRLRGSEGLKFKQSHMCVQPVTLPNTPKNIYHALTSLNFQPPQQSQPPPPPPPPARERDVLDMPTAQTGPGGVQIRKDYNPKQVQAAPHQQMQTNPQYLISPITGEKIPVDKLQDHMRYGELGWVW